jgi:hypothetical protein
VSIGVDSLDQHVIAELFAAVQGGLIQRVLEAPDEVSAVAADTTHTDDDRLAVVDRDYYDGGVISRADWSRRRNDIRRRAASRRAAAADAPGREELTALATRPDDFEATWEARSLRKRRSYIRALAATINVNPASRCPSQPSSARVEITWAG